VTRGRFVVFEGGDGSGKSTQARRLAQWLRAQGIAVHETFEPGAGATGAVIRELLLHGPESIEPIAEALLMAADRAQHVASEIEPALARGEWVVCDRYVPSSLVYQGVVRGLGIDVVEQLNAVATQGLAPDLVIVFDITDDVAAARQGGEPDRLEREGTEFHDAVRRAYRDLAPEHGWIVVDGDGPVDDVASRVHDALAPVLAG
jgi:dTMP kinase